MTHDSTSGKRCRANTPEKRLADSITYNKVRKAHDTGRNHLQNVRDYYLSLDPAQNEAIFARVLQEYEKRGLPPPVFVYNPPVSNNYSGERSGGRGGFGGGRGGKLIQSSLQSAQNAYLPRSHHILQALVVEASAEVDHHTAEEEVDSATTDRLQTVRLASVHPLQ